MILMILVVVPIYFLVWYNYRTIPERRFFVVVPIYFLVWYNQKAGAFRMRKL